MFALIGAAILLLVGATYRETIRIERPPPASLTAAMLSLLHNRAFIALNAAMMLVIVGMTVLGKSVLYYFKYFLQDPDAGQLALAWMGLVSGIAIPAWMVLERVIGLRALWLLATGLGVVGLITWYWPLMRETRLGGHGSRKELLALSTGEYLRGLKPLKECVPARSCAERAFVEQERASSVERSSAKWWHRM